MTALSLSMVTITRAWHVVMLVLTVNSLFPQSSKRAVNAANISVSAVPISKMAGKGLTLAKAAMKLMLFAALLL
jgi:hypothetical protein